MVTFRPCTTYEKGYIRKLFWPVERGICGSNRGPCRPSSMRKSAPATTTWGLSSCTNTAGETPASKANLLPDHWDALNAAYDGVMAKVRDWELEDDGGSDGH
jgi:hypothetical protein